MMEELQVAMDVTQKAGKLLLEMFGHVKPWDKGGRQLVTEADIASEKLIMETLKRRFPDHGIVSEEAGGDASGKYWIIDPLDGTHNFAYGIPQFNVCLGLMDANGVACCAVFDPMTNRMSYAERGKGAWVNGSRSKVSSRSVLDECITGFPSQRVHRGILGDSYIRGFNEVRAFGDLANSISFVASGGMDVIIVGVVTGKVLFEYPATLMVTEAGGKVTNWDGGPANVRSNAVITNGKVHEQVLKLLRDLDEGA